MLSCEIVAFEAPEPFNLFRGNTVYQVVEWTGGSASSEPRLVLTTVRKNAATPGDHIGSPTISSIFLAGGCYVGDFV